MAAKISVRQPPTLSTPRQRTITSGLPRSIQAAPSGAPDYLPTSGFGGMSMGMGADPETSGPGKAIRRQNMGSVVGMRGAGRSQIGGGDQGAHSMNHYGKGGLPGLVGGDV